MSQNVEHGTVIGTLKFDADGSGLRYWLEVDGVVMWLWAAVSDAPLPAEVTLSFSHGRISGIKQATQTGNSENENG